MKRLYAIIAVSALLSSCVKETVDPGMRISGSYAYDDGTGLSNQYVSFENGYFTEVDFTKKLSYMENSFWGYEKSIEKSNKHGMYSVNDGHLTVSGNMIGTIEIKEDCLYYKGKKYSKVNSFNETYYSFIALPDGKMKTITYEAKEYAVPVNVNRPIPAGELTASSAESWLSSVRVENSVLHFRVNETKVDRDGTVVLKYTNAENVSLSVSQRPSTFIKLSAKDRVIAYAKSSQSLSYHIENPLSGSQLTGTSNVEWVKNIAVNSGTGTILFDVDENTGSAPRIAHLTFSYTGAADVDFMLTQNKTTTVIVLAPSSQSCDYVGGDFSTVCSIENPRQGVSLTAVSQVSWITNVKVSGNVISYKVAENNSEATRTGTISFSYGSFANKTMTVTQDWSATQIRTAPTSQTVPHAGGDFIIGFSVENPRKNVSLTAASQVSWITNVAVSGNTVSYKVAANNSAFQRSGTIRLSYGSYATCDFSVNQTGELPDLSSPRSANCYIVSTAGSYGFKTVKGNSSTSVGSVSKAEVLWESFGTSTAPSKGAIISNVSYSGNYITFATPSTLKNGNAVIAAKDASGNILWSWHIWVCSGYNPVSTAQTYYNSAGTMMDRNLGATSATPGNVGSLGLLYQWGRKDPFLGSSSISSNSKAASTLSWPSAVSSNSSNGTITYAVAHPTTFISKSSTPYHWCYSQDKTLWEESKTVYDPCPPGWRVPGGGSSVVWSQAAGSSSFSFEWDSTNKGMNFSGKFGSSPTIWYPATGWLSSTGALIQVGDMPADISNGNVWSCTYSSTSAHPNALLFSANGTVSITSGASVRGYSVRCVQE